MYQHFNKSVEAAANQSAAMGAATNQSAAMETGNQWLQSVAELKHGKSRMSKIILLVTAGFFTFNSCKEEKIDKIEHVPQNVIDLVNSVDVFPVAEEWDRREDVVPGTDRSYIVSSDNPDDHPGFRRLSLDCHAFNTEWKCDTVVVSASRNPENFVMFNPLASVLWPGNLVQGASLASGVPTSVPVTKRQPGVVSLAIVTQGSAGAMMHRTVDKMSFSQVNQAMNDILSGFSGQGHAQYNFEMDVIESEAHLEFALNASFSGWGASVRAGLNSTSKKSMTRILVKLHQSYFTMVYDDPHGLDGVFTPDITINDIRNYTDNGNPICYISSVTYGRIYYLLSLLST